MGQVLSAPIRSQLLQRKGNAQIQVGASEMHGYRMTMEDQMTICLQLPKHKGLAFFGVFDGHAGDKASIYLGQHLWKRINDMKDPTNKAELSQTVQKFDAEFLELEGSRDNGSTCVIGVLKYADLKAKPKKWEITIANVGDSRAMIIRKDGKVVPLTRDHKPENPEEEKRINAAGGTVQMNRVDGQLAMSRAIGDYQYKADPKLKSDEQKVIAVPEIMTDTLYEGDLLFMCCDGIVEQMTSEEACDCIKAELQNFPDDPARVMHKVLEYSLVKGSKDNHSALLVMFQDGTKYHSEKDEFVAGPFTPWQHDSSFVKAYKADALKHGYSGDELMAMSKKTEESMPELKNIQPGARGMGGGGGGMQGGMGGLLESILAQPGNDSMKEKLMLLTSMLQGGRGPEDDDKMDEDDN